MNTPPAANTPPDSTDSTDSVQPVARIVHVLDDHIAVRDLSALSAKLEKAHGPGLTISQGRWTRFEFRTPGRLCWCITCEDADRTAVRDLLGDDHPTLLSSTFIVCPDCGNKRCPKATDHNLACGNSNDAGQVGSVYA